MIQNIERIEYKGGMLEEGIKVSDLPVISIKESEIPSGILELITDKNILSLSGSYGEKGLGTPDQYDNLKIFLTDKVVEIEFYNRAMTLFLTDDETIKGIHHLMCKIEDFKTA